MKKKAKKFKKHTILAKILKTLNIPSRKRYYSKGGTVTATALSEILFELEYRGEKARNAMDQIKIASNAISYLT